MDSYNNLPDKEITSQQEISQKFLQLGIKKFKDACLYVHNLPYGYNSEKNDKMILFKEMKGTCTTKHGVISGLAEELGIPLYKKVGIYKLTEEITKNANEILMRYSLPYVPMVHCFLVYENFHFDLTEGNNNGKKKSIEEFIYEEKVIPFITQKDEYLLFKKVLREKILLLKEMEGIEEKTILKAREEAIKLLKENIKQY